LKLARGAKDEEHTMSLQINTRVAVAGIDIGENSLHIFGQAVIAEARDCVR
jgi:hypothetical protein